MNLQDLKGQTLLSFEASGTDLEIVTDHGRFKIDAYGDCCSTGWVERARCTATLPAKIVAVNDTGWGDDLTIADGEDEPENPPEYPDVLKVWPATIRTEAGDLSFQVWNNSNGYYGSSLEISEVR